MSSSLNLRAYPSAEEQDQARRPEGEGTSAADKHSLDEIAQRLADLDQAANSPKPASQEMDSGERLAATLNRVGGLIARLQTQSGGAAPSPPRQPGQAGDPEPAIRPPSRWGDDDHRREASIAFRERLAAIRAEFDVKTSAAFRPDAQPRPAALPAERIATALPPAGLPAESPEVAQQAEVSAARAGPALGDVAAPAPADAKASVAPAPSPSSSLPSSPALQTALADIVARQRRLDREEPPVDPEPALPESDERFAPLAALQREIAALTERVQEMRPERTAAEIDALRADLHQVSRVVEPIPERQEALARGLETLTGQLGKLAKSQVPPAEFSALRAEVAQIGGQAARADSLKQLAASFTEGMGVVTARLDAFAADQGQLAELPSLKARFEELSARTAANTAGVEVALRVERQMQLVAEHLYSLPGVGDIAVIAEQMEAVAHQVASDRQTAGAQLQELRAETGAIRSRLGESERSRKSLDERVSGLAARLDEVATASQDQTTLDGIDLSRFERTLAELTSRLDSSAQIVSTERLGGLEKTVRELASRLDAAPPADDARVSQLEAAIRDLADRIEIAGAPGAGPEAVKVLERHVDRLAEQMAGLQEVTIAASERAAMAAVQRSGSEIGSNHVEALAHHLQALNKATAASERRTHNTLEAVHETLEKVIARMAVLEEEVALRAGPRADANAEPAYPGGDLHAALQRARGQTDGAVDELLEPGSGPPSPHDRDTPESRARNVRRGGSVEFIAAARRAVQSAASETRSDLDDDFPDSGSGAVRRMARIGRRPVVLGIAALVLMMGVIQLVSLGRSGPANEQLAQNLAKPPSPAANRASAQPYPPGPAGAPQSGAIPLPDLVPQGAIGDPETTASIPQGPSAPYSPQASAQQPPAGGDQLPRDIGGSRLRSLAAAGDPTAEYEVGVRYADGRGVATDLGTAAYWLERAARQNYAPAQYRLAAMFQGGQGLPKDMDAARRWYERAGLLGHLGAMHNLAVMYADGALGAQDYRQASAWFRRAAERGLTDSQVNLGVLLSLGLGVKQDVVEAYKWFAIAAAHGDKEAASQRDGVEKKLDPASLAKAKQVVQDFTPLASDPAANVVTPPSGGWDAARLATTRLQ